MATTDAPGHVLHPDARIGAAAVLLAGPGATRTNDDAISDADVIEKWR